MYANMGDMVTFEIMSVDQEPEPEIPPDLEEALAAAPEARAVWDDTIDRTPSGKLRVPTVAAHVKR